MSPSHAAELRQLLHGEVYDDPATLTTYSQDASLFTVEPQVVVYPQDVTDIKRLVQYAREEKTIDPKISLTARSAGTDMTGGPLNSSIIVSFTQHFNHLKKIGADYAIVEPGMYYRDFEKETLLHNLLLPSYPASRELCTVGGLVANNSGGEKTLTYGKTERYVQSLKMVAQDGQEYTFGPLTEAELAEKKQLKTWEGDLYRSMWELISRNQGLLQQAKPKVSKNSSGYYLWNVWDPAKKIFDLTKLIVGSQGTLGIITEITFKLIKPRPHSRLLVIFLPDLQQLGEIINQVLKFHPESFESYDDQTLKVAVRVFPELIKHMKGNLLRLAWQFLPEFWMTITGGLPKLVLIAEFTAETGEAAALQAQRALVSLRNLNVRAKVTHSESEGAKYWVVRRESFNLLRHQVQGLHTAPFIDDFVVRPERLQEFLPRLTKILNEYKIIYTIAGHIGDGNFHIIPLMDFKDPQTKKIIARLDREVYDLVLYFGGSITGEHNDGLVRSPYLLQAFGPDVYHLFTETKRIFDPLNIFNPGKKVNSSWEFALDHMHTADNVPTQSHGS